MSRAGRGAGSWTDGIDSRNSSFKSTTSTIHVYPSLPGRCGVIRRASRDYEHVPINDSFSGFDVEKRLAVNRSSRGYKNLSPSHFSISRQN